MNHSDKLLGNLLDVLLQGMQDGQTIGIPIGPDTSRLISEIILSDIDMRLSMGKSLRGTRAIDDYEFGFRSRADADTFLAQLQRELDGYELALNPTKTKIQALPQPLLDPWEVELRSAEVLGAGTGVGQGISEQRKLVLYFNKALELQKSYPEEGVLRLAITRSRNPFRGFKEWDMHQSFLLQCAMAEAGTLPYVIDDFLRSEVTYGNILDKRAIGEALNHLIVTNAPAGHSSEVAFALWGALLLNVRIGSDAARAISAMDDSVVTVLALDVHARGLLNAGFRRAAYKKYYKKEELYGANWLLAYEAAVNGWLPANTTAGYIDSDPCFGFLKAQGVKFYRCEYVQQYRALFEPPEDEDDEESDYD